MNRPPGCTASFRTRGTRNAPVTRRRNDDDVANTRTGLLIIRAWAEPGSSSPLRVQIRLTTDVSLGVERRETITEADAAIEIVQIWLLEMATTAP